MGIKTEIERIEFCCRNCNYEFLRTYPAQEHWQKRIKSVWNATPSRKGKPTKKPFEYAPSCPKCLSKEVVIASSEFIKEDEL